jgi:hypothetical protein
MKIEIRDTKNPNVVQITTIDERWYYNDKTKIYRPSSTWIANYYPKGAEFVKWVASKGWDEAELIKQEAGQRGSRVHHMCELLVLGNEIKMNDTFIDGEGEYKEPTADEWWAAMSFSDWWKQNKPVLRATEQVVESEEHNYSGTLDLEVEMDGQIWIVDIKTSKSIYPSHRIQLASYKEAYNKNAKMGIIQVGYPLNKRGWKFTEVEDCFDLFLAAKRIWYEENKDVTPKQREYPTSIKL